LLKLINTILLLAACLCLNAQAGHQYTFTHYSTANGMVSNQVNTTVQDETGYIWTGTTDGLVRFDGTRYKLFTHLAADSTSLPSNAIARLLLDKDKKLWILTANGEAGVFDTKRFRFIPSRVQVQNPGILRASLKSLLTDEAGNIFIVVRGHELLTLDKTTNTFAAANNFFQNDQQWEFTAFAQQPGTQKYWIGLQKGGIAIYDRSTGLLSYPGNNAAHERAVDIYREGVVCSNFLFAGDKVWFPVWGPGIPYVHAYNIKTQQPLVQKLEFYTQLKTYNEIEGFFAQKDGTVWVYGFKILARFNDSSRQFEMITPGYRNERSIDYRHITELYEDRENNVWIATGNNGMFRFNPSQEFFINVRHMSRVSGQPGDGNPMTYLPEKDGSLLVATWGDGLYRYNSQLDNIPLNIFGIADNNTITVWDMAPAADSNIVWMGSQPGLYKYDRRKKTMLYYNPSILDKHTVRHLAEDKKGNLWLGMQTVGVFKWDRQKAAAKFEDGLSKFNAIPNCIVTDIVKDSRGYIWVATLTEGLFVIDPATDAVLLHFHKQGERAYKLKDEGVAGVLEYSDSLVIIAASTQVIIYNRLQKQSRVLGSAQTMSGYIASLQKDDAGNLWVSTTAALYKANIKTRVFVRFNRDDGITNDFFVQGSSSRLPDGRLVFGSSGQFVVFNPNTITLDTMVPQITLTDCKVMNKLLRVDSILQLKQLELGYDNNSVAVEFSTLNQLAAYLIQYKMEGIDKDWISADKTNQAIYSYLPPGVYTLQFRTINVEGRVLISGLVLHIKVDPPFWRSWWFYSLLVLLAGALLFWLDKMRSNRKEAVQKMRAAIAGNLHQEVSTALNNINILSEMARLKADTEPQKSKEFIEQIHSRSHHMIIAMDDMLWSISPEHDSMEKTVARMREYIDALNNRHGAAITMVVEDRVKLLRLNMQFRHEAFLAFKEMIDAMLKAGIDECRITIAVHKTHLIYQVSIEKEADHVLLAEHIGTGQHAAAIGAVLKVKKHDDGYTLLLSMPVQ
jgi:ligand-binding sensor domain-containing protein/signal transduction histidine kinase